jgi:hypothetical protein
MLPWYYLAKKAAGVPFMWELRPWNVPALTLGAAGALPAVPSLFWPVFRTGTKEVSKVGCRRPLKIPLLGSDNCGMGYPSIKNFSHKVHLLSFGLLLRCGTVTSP